MVALEANKTDPSLSTYYGRGNPVFGRVVTAMVTPFKPNNPKEVDYTVAEQLAVHLAKNGSDALVIGGTTGESPTLTWSEQYELFKVVKQAVGSSVKVIAGAGSNSTDEAIEATIRADKMGLDGTLQVVPYYNKPPQEGLYQHFKAVAECAPDLPVMLYNIPGRTGINMSAEMTARLAKIPNIIATKEASGDIDQFVEIRRLTDPEFAMYSGDDAIALPLCSVGATGVVSVASHIVGNEIHKMIELFFEGHVSEALDIHLKHAGLFRDLFCMANPIPTKAALRLLGWNVGPPRLPLTDATDECTEIITNHLKSLSLL
ncbi:hypothetical protein NDN08_005110 [Rhodosorus marinus]|uniref:4-hydroxy-tetrahydrodipicolinate synthase n=1 Tax=Rhodosorus marinus TaxID=101924 RepID=A0AAV8V398_9RHOD|nr:hypothetical protein NDN08_005110 [Rhodosorus marinus]